MPLWVELGSGQPRLPRRPQRRVMRVCPTSTLRDRTRATRLPQPPPPSTDRFLDRTYNQLTVFKV